MPPPPGSFSPPPVLPLLPGPTPLPLPDPTPRPSPVPTTPPLPGPCDGVTDFERGSPYATKGRFFQSAGSISTPATGSDAWGSGGLIGAGILDGIGILPAAAGNGSWLPLPPPPCDGFGFASDPSPLPWLKPTRPLEPRPTPEPSGLISGAKLTEIISTSSTLSGPSSATVLDRDPNRSRPRAAEKMIVTAVAIPANAFGCSRRVLSHCINVLNSRRPTAIGSL